MAQDFLLILKETNDEDTQLIDKLYGQIIQNIRKIKSKEKLQKISNELKIIRKKESIRTQEDKQSLKNLESLIDSMD